MRVESGHEDAPATTFHRHTHHRVASVPWLYQHNYAHWTHWTRVTLPEGRWDLANLERIPGVLPFEIYAQASPLRLISWCSFELTQAARCLLRDLAILCEDPRTTTKIGGPDCLANTQVQNEQEATQCLATLATVHIASRAQMPTYTTMLGAPKHPDVM